MASPLSGAGPQKSFWNTYMFFPGQAETTLGKVASFAASLFLGITTLGFIYIPCYLFARRPFQAQKPEQMSPSQLSAASAVNSVVVGSPSPDDKLTVLKQQRKAILEENKRLNGELQALRKNSSLKSAADDNAAHGKISDQIMSNMLKLGQVDREIAEYERAPSVLSSAGSPSPFMDLPKVAAAPSSLNEEIVTTIFNEMQIYADQKELRLKKEGTLKSILKDFFEDSEQLDKPEAKELLVKIFAALRAKLIARMDKETYETLQRLAKDYDALEAFEDPSAFIPV